MKKTLSAVIGLTALSLLAASPVQAGPIDNLFGGVNVVGHLEMNNTVGNVVTIAKGKNARAVTTIGSIHEGTIFGHKKITTNIGTVVNKVKGTWGNSCVSIASSGGC